MFHHKEEKAQGGVVGFTRWPGENGRDKEEFEHTLISEGLPPSFVLRSTIPPNIPTGPHSTPPLRRCALVSSVPTTSLPRWSTSTRRAPIWRLNEAHKSSSHALTAGKGQGVGFMVELEGADDREPAIGWLGWIRMYLERLSLKWPLEPTISSRLVSFSFSVASYTIHNDLRRSSRYAYLSSPTCSVSSRLAGCQCQLADVRSIGGRWLGCTKGRRIASTHFSLELAAASAGDRV